MAKLPIHFSGPFHSRTIERNLRIFRQSTVPLRMIDVVQHVDDVRAADARRIVHSRVLVRGVFAQLLGALLGQILHVVLGAEMQAAGGTRFDAGRLQARAHAIRTQRTLVNLLGFVVELRNIERATGHAILAADAVFLLEIDDAVGVLHDGAVGRTRQQATWIGAVHALVLAHQPTEVAIAVHVLVEADQVVVVPRHIRHGLVGVVENGFAERIAVPFQARYFARFAADAGGDVDQLAHVVIARCIPSGDGSGVSGDGLDLEWSVAIGSRFLQLHQESLELGGVSVGIGHCGREQVRDAARNPAGVLLNAAEALMNRDADLIDFFAVDRHGPDAARHHRFGEIDGAGAGHLDPLPALIPKSLASSTGISTNISGTNWTFIGLFLVQ